MKRPALTMLAVIWSLGPVTAENTPADLKNVEQRMIYRRAVEAVIWGMPAVNTNLMLQAMLRDTAAKPNEVVYWSKPVDWRNQTLTPNPDAIYLMVFFDLKEIGPLVIDVPPADGGSFAANIDTVWQMPMEDAGPYGADRGAGGQYLVLPPAYKEKAPDGYIAMQSETFTGYALFRSNLRSHGDRDVAEAVSYGKRLKVYPLSKAASPPETKFTDAKDVVYDSTIPYDLRFFQSLDRIVQTEPWQGRDKAMIGQMRSIGIEKGKPFTPDTKMADILNAAAAEAHEFLDRKLDEGFPPFFASARWAVPAFPALIKAASSGYSETDTYPVDARALTYSIGYIGIKRLGTAQAYLIETKDKEGAAFDGSATYQVHVPPNVPAEQYWSVTAYDRLTHALIRNMSRASRASNVVEVEKNGDGSVDVYFGPKAVVGKETNWVPTDPKRGFELMFRVYAPKKEFFEKVWTLPDAEKITVQ